MRSATSLVGRQTGRDYRRPQGSCRKSAKNAEFLARPHQCVRSKESGAGRNKEVQWEPALTPAERSNSVFARSRTASRSTISSTSARPGPYRAGDYTALVWTEDGGVRPRCRVRGRPAIAGGSSNSKHYPAIERGSRISPCVRITEPPAALLERFDQLAEALCISTITLGGLLCGVERSASRSQNLQGVEQFTARLEVIPFSVKAVAHFDQIRSELARLGTPLGACTICLLGPMRVANA